MDQNNILAGNKLIAEFMGAKWWPQTKRIFVKFSGCYEFPNAKVGYPPNKLLFDSNWEWLMSVVEKIESLDCTLEVQIFRNCARVLPDDFHDFLIPKVEATKKEAVWGVCVEFIKWYNLNKKQDNGIE